MQRLVLWTKRESNFLNILKVYTFVSNEMGMKNLSLKLEDDIFIDVEDIVSRIDKKRNKYINEAVSFYNKLYKRKLMRSLLLEESKVAYGSSMDILAEFEEIEDDGFLLD